jgi:hypothetical protein
MSDSHGESHYMSEDARQSIASRRGSTFSSLGIETGAPSACGTLSAASPTTEEGDQSPTQAVPAKTQRSWSQSRPRIASGLAQQATISEYDGVNGEMQAGEPMTTLPTRKHSQGRDSDDAVVTIDMQSMAAAESQDGSLLSACTPLKTNFYEVFV